MTPETVFLVCNYGVLPAWMLLVLAPGHAWTQHVVHAVWIPLALGVIYAWGILANPGGPDSGNMLTLGGVITLFSNPYVALIGWVHYLAFDLFIGAWEVRDARRRGVPHWAVVPCLVLTLAAGPLGLLAYLLLRFVWAHDAGLQESP